MVFTRSYAPDDIVAQIRTRRVSVLVCVPKILEVLRDYMLTRRAGDRERSRAQDALDDAVVATTGASTGCSASSSGRWSSARRRSIPMLEAFWGRLGFVVVQGYGLTETAPIVTLNHPFHAARGAVGKPIAGVEVRIADDGEILVRGENVTRGYFNAPEETRTAFRDGWFHTGDIGELDDQGQLHIRGRKKEMIVTPEGLNVFPEDVERALNEQPGVRESAVVGAPRRRDRSAERVQAVSSLASRAPTSTTIVRGANTRLQDHQKIRAGDGVAGRRAAAHRGHAQAEAARAARLAAAVEQAPARRRAGAGGGLDGASRAVVAALRAGPHHRAARRRSTSSA